MLLLSTQCVVFAGDCKADAIPRNAGADEILAGIKCSTGGRKLELAISLLSNYDGLPAPGTSELYSTLAVQELFKGVTETPEIEKLARAVARSRSGPVGKGWGLYLLADHYRSKNRTDEADELTSVLQRDYRGIGPHHFTSFAEMSRRTGSQRNIDNLLAQVPGASPERREKLANALIAEMKAAPDPEEFKNSLSPAQLANLTTAVAFHQLEGLRSTLKASEQLESKISAASNEDKIKLLEEKRTLLERTYKGLLSPEYDLNFSVDAADEFVRLLGSDSRYRDLRPNMILQEQRLRFTGLRN